MDPMDDLNLDLEQSSVPATAPAAPLVLIAQAALSDMDAHAAAEQEHEIGGIMVGAVIEGSQPVVIVEAAIRGMAMTYTRGSVTFTHDTWSHINRIKDEQYPDKRIVGWYHSHPGFGIFLSNYDTFIHQSFFAAPWQIAYVTDPKARTSGCFSWQSGLLAQDHSFQILADPHAHTGHPDTAPATDVARSALPVELAAHTLPPTRDTGLMAALWALAIGVALLAAFAVSNFYSISRLPTRSELQQTVAPLQMELQAVRRAVSEPDGGAQTTPPAETTATPALVPPATGAAPPPGPTQPEQEGPRNGDQPGPAQPR